MLNYALLVAGGTATNPTSVALAPIAFSNGAFVFFLNRRIDRRRRRASELDIVQSRVLSGD